MSVQANPYQLRHTAQQFLMGASELRDKVNRLLVSKGNLFEGRGAWEGDGADSFSLRSEQYEDKIRKGATTLERAATALNGFANQMERVIDLLNRAQQLEMESYECGGDSMDDLHRRQSLLHQAHQLRQEAEWEANAADSQAEHVFREIRLEIDRIDIETFGGMQPIGGGELDDLPEPLRRYYLRHPELYSEYEESQVSDDEPWYEETWDWLKGQGNEFVAAYKQHWTTGNILYDEVNYWTLGIPDKFTRVFHTKPFSWDNLVANLDLFVSVVPATKLESGTVDVISGASKAVEGTVESKAVSEETDLLIGGLKPGSLSNVEARKWYLEQEATIPSLLDKNLPIEQQAKQAFDLRNQFRRQARELMEDRELAEKLMREEPNLSWEQVVQKAKDKGYTGDDVYNYIIHSSQRSRKSVNEALGLGKKGEEANEFTNRRE